MIDYENIRTTVVKGLKEYLKCPVIRSNQNAEPPKYSYVSYTVTTPMTQNKGTYGEYEDGKARKPVTSIWSFTAQSNDDIECFTLATKAREWLDYVGSVYLKDNNVTVQSVGNVTNRDNILTSEYEYKKGFDVVFWVYDVVDIPDNGSIEILTIVERDINKMLEDRLDGVESITYSGNPTHEDEEALNKQLEERLDGVT